MAFFAIGRPMAEPCRFLFSFERTAAEDLSSPRPGTRKTCPVLGGGTNERLVWWTQSGGPRLGPLSRGRLSPARRNAARQRALSVAEADGNRTRRRAFARPPILKACPTLALPLGR